LEINWYSVVGVAFEQGKVLPTPETVPFRLTRDVVDGMGVSGVEGTFRRLVEMKFTFFQSLVSTPLTMLAK
jgi:ataxia telangiectasia mutated family protein